METKEKAVVRQRLNEQLSSAIHSQTTKRELLEAVFSKPFVTRFYNENTSRVGWNSGDKREGHCSCHNDDIQCLGYENGARLSSVNIPVFAIFSSVEYPTLITFL